MGPTLQCGSAIYITGAQRIIKLQPTTFNFYNKKSSAKTTDSSNNSIFLFEPFFIRRHCQRNIAHSLKNWAILLDPCSAHPTGSLKRKLLFLFYLGHPTGSLLENFSKIIFYRIADSFNNWHKYETKLASSCPKSRLLMFLFAIGAEFFSRSFTGTDKVTWVITGRTQLFCNLRVETPSYEPN